MAFISISMPFPNDTVNRVFTVVGSASGDGADVLITCKLYDEDNTLRAQASEDYASGSELAWGVELNAGADFLNCTIVAEMRLATAPPNDPPITDTISGIDVIDSGGGQITFP